MLRLIPTAAHSDADVAETIAAFEAISDKLKSGLYANSDISMMV
jgi:glycine C-acetyltransferase